MSNNGNIITIDLSEIEKSNYTYTDSSACGEDITIKVIKTRTFNYDPKMVPSTLTKYKSISALYSAMKKYDDYILKEYKHRLTADERKRVGLKSFSIINLLKFNIFDDMINRTGMFDITVPDCNKPTNDLEKALVLFDKIRHKLINVLNDYANGKKHPVNIRIQANRRAKIKPKTIDIAKTLNLKEGGGKSNTKAYTKCTTITLSPFYDLLVRLIIRPIVIKATAYKELKTLNGSTTNVDAFLSSHHDTTTDAILQHIEKTNKALRTDLTEFRKLINTKITFNKVVNVINTDKMVTVRESKATRVLNLDLNCDLLTATERPSPTKAKTTKAKATKGKATKAAAKPKRVTRKKSTKDSAIVKPITAANDDFSEDDFGNSRIDQHIPKAEAKKIQASIGKHIKGKYGSGTDDPLDEDIADYVSDVGNGDESDNGDDEPNESDDGYEYDEYNDYADEHDTSNEASNEADSQPEESEEPEAEEPEESEELEESEDGVDPDEELVERIADDIGKYMDKWSIRTKVGKEELSNLYDEIHSNMEAVLDTHNADLIEQLHNILDEVYKSLPVNVRRTKAAVKRKFTSMIREYIKKTA